MDNQFKERLAFYDPLSQRVTLHYYFNGEKVLRIVFNFMKDMPDHIDGCLRDYLPMTKEEETVYMEQRRGAAWKRLCEVPVY